MDEQAGHSLVLIEWRMRAVEKRLDELLEHEKRREQENKYRERKMEEDSLAKEYQMNKDRKDFFWKTIIGPTVVGLLLVLAEHYWKAG